MDAFAQFAVLITTFVGFTEAAIESFELIDGMIKEKRLYVKNIGAFFFVLFFAASIKLNIFILAGIEGSGNFFYNFSYFTLALIGMRGSGVLHDWYSWVKKRKLNV